MRFALNFLTGIAVFIAGGWLGQWTFTVNLVRAFADFLHSGEFRAIPAYTVGPWSLSWHVAFFVSCGSSVCVGDVPAVYVLSSDLIFLAVSVVEVVWFWRLLRTSIPRNGQ